MQAVHKKTKWQVSWPHSFRASSCSHILSCRTRSSKNVFTGRDSSCRRRKSRFDCRSVGKRVGRCRKAIARAADSARTLRKLPDSGHLFPLCTRHRIAFSEVRDLLNVVDQTVEHPSDKKSLFWPCGHWPAWTGLKERFHGRNGSKARVEGASRTTRRPPGRPGLPRPARRRRQQGKRHRRRTDLPPPRAFSHSRISSRARCRSRGMGHRSRAR